MPEAYLIENGVVIASGTFKEVPEGWTEQKPANAPKPPTGVIKKYSKENLVSPVTFKMSFTVQERIAIAQLRADGSPENISVKLFLDDWYAIMDDPRLEYVNLGLPSIRSGLEYLVSLNVLTEERVEEILSGKVQ